MRAGQSVEMDRQRTWETDGVRPAERFAYYREAICQAFMKLTPEPPAAPKFSARLQHVRLGDGALNRVAFPEHMVRRSPADIATSDRRCFYLNLKLAGRCSIQQGDREMTLSPGQVGIFDSGRTFELRHDKASMLGVASFWVPAEALLSRLPPSFDIVPSRVSDDPDIGALIAETARTLNARAMRMSDEAGSRLFDVLLDLVALGLSRKTRAGAKETASIADATAAALHRAVNKRLREPGLKVADVAGDVGISNRYVHALLARSGTTFSDHVMARRLDAIEADLRRPATAARDIGSIAFDWGFADLSHFSRRFKERFGMRARDWRAAGTE